MIPAPGGAKDGSGRLLLAIALTATLASCTEEAPPPAAPSGHPFVAAHRGDPALPENTLEAFRSALEAGADYVETDLVASNDGVLVLRHERRLSLTTDVEDRREFADRRVTKRIGARRVTDWWVEDFTSAELATLRATRRGASPSGDHRIPTLRDLIALARETGLARGRPVGLYLETKEPGTFERLGYDLEDILAEALRAEGLDRREGDVVLQSWSEESVRELSAGLRVPTVQLIGGGRVWDDAVSSRGLRRLHREGLAGINVVDERLEREPRLVERAHAAGLVVHGWGFEPGEDYDRWMTTGLDGFVTRDVAAVLAARERGAASG